MDLSLSDLQRDVQETVRRFVDERILPHAVANDQAHRLDRGVIEGMADLGLLGVVVPEAYGGAGLDFVTEALVCEEIERGEAAFRTLISVHVGLNSLRRAATSEPASGISYAAVADHALVFAKTDPAAGHRGISAFVVELDAPGVEARTTEAKLGVWAGNTGELFFTGCEVPAEHRLGEEGQGFEIAMAGLDQGRFTVAAGAVGVVRACLERSLAYANERRAFGQPIGRNQFVQDLIFDMVEGYETSKLLVMQAAWLKDQGRRSSRETSLAKVHATEAAFRAAQAAVRIHGAAGYAAEVGVERYLRNATAPIIYEGTTQIHKMLQAEHALGYRAVNGRRGEMSPLVAWQPGRPQDRNGALAPPAPAEVTQPVDARPLAG
ncbi:MAG: acyl-CoA dehydrogenase family protein [Actinomycetota bacterium]|nr:acyl-CoA dehydrogenase family protein [Actinomycetota bacterium]